MPQTHSACIAYVPLSGPISAVVYLLRQHTSPSPLLSFNKLLSPCLSISSSMPEQRLDAGVISAGYTDDRGRRGNRLSMNLRPIDRR
jgi:hypothetical protein